MRAQLSLVEHLVANQKVAGSNPVARTTHTMYRIYYTDPKTMEAGAINSISLHNAIVSCELFRKNGYLYVTMVSDYQDMVGKPGAQGAGSEYVPQLKN